MKRFTKTRTRKVLTATMSTLLICAAAAFAYYLFTATFTGEKSGTLATGVGTPVSEALTVTIPAMEEGFMVAREAPYVIKATVKPVKALSLEPGAKLAAVFTTSEPIACKPAWFSLWAAGSAEGFTAHELIEKGGASTKAIALTTAVQEIAGLELKFLEKPTENQQGCNGATLTVKLTLTGTSH